MISNLHIMLSVSDSYLPHAAATIASIVENCCGVRLISHIATDGLSSENEKYLSLFQKDYCEIELLDITPYLAILKDCPCGKWGVYPSMKPLAPMMFPSIDRLLYIDSDIIIIRDISDHISIDFV